jgi:hypothetical protein
LSPDEAAIRRFYLVAAMAMRRPENDYRHSKLLDSDPEDRYA